MCEDLIRFIEERFAPIVRQMQASFEDENGDEGVEEMEDLMQALQEIVEDIRNGIMEEWECGELYEEFKRYEQNGTLIENLG